MGLQMVEQINLYFEKIHFHNYTIVKSVLQLKGYCIFHEYNHSCKLEKSKSTDHLTCPNKGNVLECTLIVATLEFRQRWKEEGDGYRKGERGVLDSSLWQQLSQARTSRHMRNFLPKCYLYAWELWQVESDGLIDFKPDNMCSTNFTIKIGQCRPAERALALVREPSIQNLALHLL